MQPYITKYDPDLYYKEIRTLNDPARGSRYRKYRNKSMGRLYYKHVTQSEKKRDYFSNYYLLIQGERIVAQLEITAHDDFCRFSNFNVFNASGLERKVDKFVKWAIGRAEKANKNKIYAFLPKRNSRLIPIYIQAGFKMDKDHGFNAFHHMGYPLILQGISSQ